VKKEFREQNLSHGKPPQTLSGISYMKSEKRTAFILDALPSLGGAEKVLFTALEAYPCADVFTLVYNKGRFLGTPVASRRIGTSFLNALPFAQKHHRLFLPLMPLAIERFDLHGYDVIVSFTYAVAHGVRSHNSARHIAYTYTPMRYAWTDLNIDGTRTRKRLAIDQFLNAFRKWDRRAASRVDEFAAISKAVAERIRPAWQREACIIYPPVEIERFQPSPMRDTFYITVSRLVPHKRIDLLVQAFSQLQLPLIVIGDGPELVRLKALASPNIRFLGYETDVKTADLLGKARAFVCAAEEDFGIAIVEAQAAGCPVIAYGKGGALESVVDGVTGRFFTEQTVTSLVNAIQEFEGITNSFRTADIVQNAQRFGKVRFLQEFKQFVERDS
jgi:glycosyltransferase involved in cell wall biosynthesis